MRMRNVIKPAILALVASGMTSAAVADTAFVLDGYKYSSPINIVYRTDNQKVKNPDITNCTAAGIPVVDIQIGTTLKTGDNIHIALNAVNYSLAQGRFYLTSVLGNVICQDGVYEDDLFVGGFEQLIDGKLFY